uniref:NtA domain-containing protein n=1 Tax=Syphacia muris TaxID=451379 RepID=A0A0N5B119_9BILA
MRNELVALQAAKVAVKRVIKGKAIMPKLSEIVIHGIGNSKICRSVLYERDTKIIMLYVDNERYHLNPPIVSINLDILDLMDSIIRGFHLQSFFSS